MTDDATAVRACIDAISVYCVLRRSRFLRYLTFFLNFFQRFFIVPKTLSNAKYEYAKIQRKLLLQYALAMIFIDFGLLRSP